jgi:hypothetical protein
MVLFEKSKQIVHEIIQPSAQDHAAAGKGHDFPDSRPVIPAVAMDMAFFTGWFRFQRAVAPLLHGMFRNCRTLRAKNGFLAGYILDINIHLVPACML